MDYTITTYSNRMYDLDPAICLKLDNTINVFSREVYSSYNRHFLKEYNTTEFEQKYGNKSLHMITKENLNCDTYYANSITQLAKGKLKSQIELNEMYINDKEQTLKAIDKKISESIDKLAAYEKTLNNLYEYREKLKTYPKAKLKVSRFKNISSNGYKIIVRTPCKNKIISKSYGLYEFEYQYLTPKIKSLKNLISKLKYRKNNVLVNKNNLEKPKHIVFGGNKNIKNLSREELHNKKYYEFSVSGRKDAALGNFVFKAIPISDNSFNINFHLIDNEEISLNVRFPYKGEKLAKVLTKDVPNKKMTPICFGIVRKIDSLGRKYYQVKVSFNIGSTIRENNYAGNGVIGMDFNFGHLDLSEIDDKGNMIGHKTFYYKVDGTSKGNELSLRKALNEVGKYVLEKKKILVVEKLDTSKSKQKSTYGDKKTNRIFHMLPYSKYLAIVDYIGLKYEFLVIKVNPSFTSVIGAIKYKDNMKLNGHIAASFVIARRGMPFTNNEKVPKKLRNYITNDLKTKNYWAKFSKINKELKKQNKKNKELIG